MTRGEAKEMMAARTAAAGTQPKMNRKARRKYNADALEAFKNRPKFVPSGPNFKLDALAKLRSNLGA